MLFPGKLPEMVMCSMNVSLVLATSKITPTVPDLPGAMGVAGSLTISGDWFVAVSINGFLPMFLMVYFTVTALLFVLPMFIISVSTAILVSDASPLSGGIKVAFIKMALWAVNAFEE